ncbi:IS1 family transposase [Hymenobacter sp. BRD128]|nr:IS1 family transposase [Hymenobacter sp. BRD128]
MSPAKITRTVCYEQVTKLLVERNSQRNIVRATGVARMTVAKLVKKAKASRPLPAELLNKLTDLELDEMWTFVGRRKDKMWLWRVVERATWHIGAWVLGCRGTATVKRLCQALPARYQQHTVCYTDERETYAKVLPIAAHRSSTKGSGATSIVEPLNCALRQRCGVLARKL